MYILQQICRGWLYKSDLYMVINQEYFFLTYAGHLSLIHTNTISHKAVFSKINWRTWIWKCAANFLINFGFLFIALHGLPSLAVWLQLSPLLTNIQKLSWNSSTKEKSWKGALGFNTSLLTPQLQRKSAMCMWTLSKTPQMTPHMH